MPNPYITVDDDDDDDDHDDDDDDKKINDHDVNDDNDDNHYGDGKLKEKKLNGHHRHGEFEEIDLEDKRDIQFDMTLHEFKSRLWRHLVDWSENTVIKDRPSKADLYKSATILYSLLKLIIVSNKNRHISQTKFQDHLVDLLRTETTQKAAKILSEIAWKICSEDESIPDPGFLKSRHIYKLKKWGSTLRNAFGFRKRTGGNKKRMSSWQTTLQNKKRKFLKKTKRVWNKLKRWTRRRK